MSRYLSQRWGTVLLCLSWAGPVGAVVPFHVNMFESGTTEGWSGGANPVVVPDGGPGGSGDAFLQLTSNGLVGPGSRMATFNDDPNWVGDYASTNIRAVTVDLMNPTTSTPLAMRLVFMEFLTFSEWTSTQPVMVPNDGIWRSYRFYVAESELTQVDGSTPYATMISNISRVMFRHNTGAPSTTGTVVAATLQIDNARVVPTIDCQVFDGLVAAIASGMNDPQWDLNRDTLVDLADLDTLRTIGGLVNLPSGNPYLPGDANLDGFVDASDFNSWNSHKYSTAASWCSGDFNADGLIDASDFNIWNTRKYTASDGAAAVPEPVVSLVMVLGGLLVGCRRTGLRRDGAP